MKLWRTVGQAACMSPCHRRRRCQTACTSRSPRRYRPGNSTRRTSPRYVGPGASRHPTFCRPASRKVTLSGMPQRHQSLPRVGLLLTNCDGAYERNSAGSCFRRARHANLKDTNVQNPRRAAPRIQGYKQRISRGYNATSRGYKATWGVTVGDLQPGPHRRGRVSDRYGHAVHSQTWRA